MKMREKVERHMRKLQRRADVVVRKNRDSIIAVAAELRARRHLTGEEIRRIHETTITAGLRSRKTVH